MELINGKTFMSSICLFGNNRGGGTIEEGYLNLEKINQSNKNAS